jgi:predicted phage terminase large subunit-like protein
MIKPELLNLLEDPDFERRLRIETYNESYYEFFKDAYKALLPNEPYNDNWHIKYICDKLQEIQTRVSDRKIRRKDTIINVPFRSAKSLMVTVMFPVWCWTKDQSLSFITTSYAASLAEDHSQKSRDLINTLWFKEHYPDAISFSDNTNTKQEYKITGGGYRKAVGVGGQITGSGASIIICDDPQDPKRAASEVERKNTINFYTGTLYSRLNQPEIGHRIIVQQRLHEQDLTGYLLENFPDSYEHICIPAEIDQESNVKPIELTEHYIDNLFWNTRFSRRVINDFIKILGSQQAAGQLQQRPAPLEGDMIKKSWFDIVDPSTITRDTNHEPIMFYLDTAESEESKLRGDQTAMFVGFKQNNYLYVCNILLWKQEFYQLVKTIPDACINNGYTSRSYIKIEPKSSGKSIVSQLRGSTNLNVMELPAPKDDKITRLSAITPILESRRVKLLAGNYVTPFLNNLAVFPNGKNDDDVDAFIHAVEDTFNENANFDFVFA